MIMKASIQGEVDGIINVCTGKPMSLADKVASYITEKNRNIRLEDGYLPDSPYDSPGIWGDAAKIEAIMANGAK